MGNPLFVKNASIKFVIPPALIATATEFNCDVHLAEIVATPGDDVTYQTLCQNGTLTQKGATTYVLHIVAVQDWSTTGFARFLWTNAGVTVRAVVQAYGATQAFDAAHPGFDTSVVLVEPTYGGEADTWAELDVELPCTVRPVLLTAAPTAEFAPEPESEAVAA